MTLRGILSIISWIISCIAMRKLFKKAGRPWRWGLIPVVNAFLLRTLADEKNLLKYELICSGIFIASIFLGIRILAILSLLWIIVFGFIMNYSLAQNFWWKKSASCLFAICNIFFVTWIWYLVLWLSNDEYIWYTWAAHFHKNSMDENTVRGDNSIDISQPDIQSVDLRTSDGMNWIENLDNISWNDISSSGVIDWNTKLENINVDELTPIWTMERPKHDPISWNL